LEKFVASTAGAGRRRDVNVFTAPRSEVLTLHATSVIVPATRNNRVQTASLQCFDVISKSCSFVDLEHINDILK